MLIETTESPQSDKTGMSRVRSGGSENKAFLALYNYLKLLIFGTFRGESIAWSDLRSGQENARGGVSEK